MSISTQFSSICTIDRTLSGASTPSQSEPGSVGNKRVLRIPQSFWITGSSPSDCLVSYPGHLLWGSHFSAEMQSVYSGAPANRAKGKDIEKKKYNSSQNGNELINVKG